MLRRSSCPSGIVATACQKKQVGKGQEAMARTKILHLLPNPPKTPVPTQPIPVAHAVSIPNLQTALTDRRCTAVYKSSSLKRRTVTGNMPICGASLVATAMPSPVFFFDADDKWRKGGTVYRNPENKLCRPKEMEIVVSSLSPWWGSWVSGSCSPTAPDRFWGGIRRMASGYGED